ncbi:MAG: tetratricopeptide repeat protein [Balneola sp.]
MDFRNLIAELKRRNVIRVATAYAIAGWLIIQICATTFPFLNLPEWLITAVIIFVLIGFPLSLIFAWAFELTPEGLKKSKEVEITESVTNRTGKKLNGIIITVLSMAVIFLLVERVFFAEAAFIQNQSEIEFETASIAVLPFVDMSAGQDQEYFSDGLSEELLNALAKVEDMKVAGRTSSFKFKGKNENLKLIGDELNVQHILEGSVRKSGNRIRITAQLIKADDGFHLWSETFDRELTTTNIFDIQEEISRTVLKELKVRLLDEDEAELDNVPTQDIEAYQAYLKANSFIAERNIDKINLAIDLYKNALNLDPTFSEAYARLAIAYNLQGYYGNVPFDQVQEQVKENAEKALSINNNEANAYAALGLYHANTFETDKAIEKYEQSIKLNPNNPDVYNWLSIAYQEKGDLKKSNEAFKKMYAVDPLSPLSIYNRASVHFYEGEYDDALALFQKNIDDNPEFALTYAGLSVLKALPPYGQLDESFKYSTTARAYGRDSRALGILLLRALDLQLEDLADHYFTQLKNQYGSSYEYISYIPYYSIFKKDYSYLREDMFEYIDENDLTIPSFSFYISLLHYGNKTGDYDRVLNEFRKFEPGFFEEEIPALEIRNFSQARLLADVYKNMGNKERATQLYNAHCKAVEANKNELDLGEDGEAYLVEKYICLINQEKYEEALPYFERVFLELNRKLAAWYLFETLPSEVYEIEGYQKVIDEVQSELDQQRSNVIQFLKEEGEWKEEWEEN